MDELEEKKVKKKTKVKNNKKIIYVALALIIIYVLYAIFLLTTEQSKTFTVEQGKIYIEETNTGYIIRDENVVKGENYKNGMEQIKAEGERVGVNESVFRYYSQNESNLKQQILELDKKIQTVMQQSIDIFSSDVKTIENQIDEKIVELNKLTDNSKINEYKKEINELVAKKAKIAGESSPQGSYLKQLIGERAGYENELNSGAEYIKSNRSGIVSYRVDGLEETLNPNNLESLSEEYLNNLNLKTGKIIATNEECGKIIDNFTCYIATISNSKQAQNAEIGDKVKVRLSNNSEIDAKIKYIKNENGKYLIVLELNVGINELVNYRKISFDLIWLSYSGLKVPNQAIVEEDGLKYVVRKRAGYLSKILVKIASNKKGKEAVNDKYTIIENYTVEDLEKLGYSNKKINSYRGIALYDEVILNPDLSKIE